MYKQIIDSRNESNVIFLRCYCGGEIISIYYYPATTTCQEILALDYFGIIKNKKLQKYKYYNFTRDTFSIFINNLENCLVTNIYDGKIECIHSFISINKNNNIFTEISLYIKNMKKKTSTKVWDITIRNQELKEFIFQLKQMQNNISNGV